jgi:hypothetical protein
VPYGAGTNLVSADGLNWATLNTGISNPLGKISYANGLFIAMAGTNVFISLEYVASSVDGTNWWQYAPRVPGIGSSVATDGSRLVRVGSTYYGYYENGYVYRSDPLVNLRMSNSAGAIVLSGLVGRSYRIESTDTLTNSGLNDWQLRFSGQLPTDPFLWIDPTSATSTQRYYRAALLP